MLAGIYYGAQYGGSTTAILVNIPGEIVLRRHHARRPPDGAAAAAPDRALGIAAIGSFVAGCIATLVVAYFAPPLAELALKFGPAEYFSLMVFGLIAAVVLARGSLLKAIAMVCFGILLGPDRHRRQFRRHPLRLRLARARRRASASSRSPWRSSASPT